MTDFKRRMREDEMLRSAAKDLLRTDLALVKADLKGRGPVLRVFDRIGEGTAEIAEDSAGFASTHRGLVAAGVAALVAYVLRHPLGALLSRWFDGEDSSEAEPEAAPGGSPDARPNPAESDHE